MFDLVAIRAEHLTFLDLFDYRFGGGPSTDHVGHIEVLFFIA